MLDTGRVTVNCIASGLAQSTTNFLPTAGWCACVSVKLGVGYVTVKVTIAHVNLGLTNKLLHDMAQFHSWSGSKICHAKYDKWITRCTALGELAAPCAWLPAANGAHVSLNYNSPIKTPNNMMWQ